MTSVTIRSWDEIIPLLKRFTPKIAFSNVSPILYRGQSDSAWKLSTSISRLVPEDIVSRERANFYEREAMNEFRKEAHLLDSRMTYPEDAHPYLICVDMQHYSFPTRLMDWTLSPYIALYFAVSENIGKDGALFVFNYLEYKQNLDSAYPKALTGNMLEEIGNNSILDFVELPIPIKKNNERISRQQGRFTISNHISRNHCDIIEAIAESAGSSVSGLYKITIPAELKYECLAQLKVMNITPASLFPGLDGLGRSVKDLMLIRRWIEKK